MGGGGGGRRITVTQRNFMGDLGYICARAEYEVKAIICWLHCRVLVSKKEEKWDQYQYLGKLPTYPSPNPTLTLTCYQLTVVVLNDNKTCFTFVDSGA